MYVWPLETSSTRFNLSAHSFALHFTTRRALPQSPPIATLKPYGTAAGELYQAEPQQNKWISLPSVPVRSSITIRSNIMLSRCGRCGGSSWVCGCWLAEFSHLQSHDLYAFTLRYISPCLSHIEQGLKCVCISNRFDSERTKKTTQNILRVLKCDMQ